MCSGSRNDAVNSSLLFEKVYGCLIGVAIGDAIGAPFEMMHYKKIRREFGWVTEIVECKCPPGYLDPSGPIIGGNGLAEPSKRPSQVAVPAGRYTDDTKLTFLLARAIINSGGRVTAQDLAKTWEREMNPLYFYYPVFNSYCKYLYRVAEARDIGRDNIPSNSSAMSISPVGIINACDPRQATLDAYEVASLIHSGYARDAACVIAAAVAEAFDPNATVESVIEASIRYLPESSMMRPYVERAIDLATRCSNASELIPRFYEECIVPVTVPSTIRISDEEFNYTADPREAVPCALAMFYVSRGDPEQTVIGAANFGRDSDTIASMAGAVAGAFAGVSGFPERWVTLCEGVNEQKTKPLAEGMLRALHNEIALVEHRLSDLRRLSGTCQSR